MNPAPENDSNQPILQGPPSQGTQRGSLGHMLNRRDLLKVGGLSIAATAVPAGIFAGATSAQAARTTQGTAKSVIYLWMGGGVTHIDSFDPKPNAPVEVRGILNEIATNLPGVRFCETLPKLASMADQLALVRSYSHDSNDHLLSQVYTLSGHKVSRTQLFDEPNIGSIVSHLYGPNNGLPGYIAVPGITRPGPPPHNLFVAGWLGSQYRPYCLGGVPQQPDFTAGDKLDNPPAEFKEELTPRSLSLGSDISLERLDRRVRLRDSLDRALRSLENQQSLVAQEGRFRDALRMLRAPQVRNAFDLESESDRVRDNYGRTKIGGRCLMACRLVEAGARFVMVDYGYDPDYGNLWDNHNAPSQNHPPLQKMVKRGYHLAGMDKAFAALIGDLRQRGLLESTLVVFLTEFGRSPKINKNGGRDHWGSAGSIFFAGGGTQVGQVIGQTDNQGAKPLTKGYTPADIAATIYKAIGINPQAYIPDFQGRPRHVLDEGTPIDGVL